MNSQGHDTGPAPERAFSYAFQPIVDVSVEKVVSYEALIRGAANEPAFQVLGHITPEQLPGFDQQARVAAIWLATRLGIACRLNLNFVPQSLDSSMGSIFTTLDAATRTGLPVDRVVLEVTEGEIITDQVAFARLFNEYRAYGLNVAIDDFGAGYSGLNLLANFQPDQIKLDMSLVRGIESHGPRQAIVRAIGQASADLGIDVIAEGIETVAEYSWLANEGFRLFQGYLFARPGFECLPEAIYPSLG